MASIAKLAIQITTDTTRMSAGLQRAQAELTRFRASADTSSAALGGLNAGMFRAGLAASAAFIGVQKLNKFLSSARQAAAELQDRLDAVNGTTSNTENLNRQYKRLWETIGVVGLPVVNRMAGALDNLLGAFEAANRREGLGSNDQFIKNLERREAAMKKAAEDAKAASQAREEQERAEEDFRSRMFQKAQREVEEFYEKSRTEARKSSMDLRAQTFGVAEFGSQQAAATLAAAQAQARDERMQQQMLASLKRQEARQAIKIVSGGF